MKISYSSLEEVWGKTNEHIKEDMQNYNESFQENKESYKDGKEMFLKILFL